SKAADKPAAKAADKSKGKAAEKPAGKGKAAEKPAAKSKAKPKADQEEQEETAPKTDVPDLDHEDEGVLAIVNEAEDLI
ncbi:hypothetical protein ACXWOQ_10090, partial [Streptococcus pyogenes]